MRRIPSHSLARISASIPQLHRFLKSDGYSIVVAVPTKNRLAFSPPALLGWSFVSLASGSWAGGFAPAGRSRVGGSETLGSRVRCFMITLYHVRL